MDAPPRPPRIKNHGKADPDPDESLYMLYSKPQKSRDATPDYFAPLPPIQNNPETRSPKTDGDRTIPGPQTTSERTVDRSTKPGKNVRIASDEEPIYDVPRRRTDPSQDLPATSATESSAGGKHVRDDNWVYDLAGDFPACLPDPHYPALTRTGGATAVMKPGTLGTDTGSRETRQSKPLAMKHSCMVEDDKIKIVLELKSPESPGGAYFSRMPIRLVCLFDISGSMGQKFGAKSKLRRETKIVKMRNVAKILTTTLDASDYLGVLAFGGDTEVLSPLTKNEPSAKKEVLSKVRELGRNGLSLTTNLSQGLMAAIDLFRQDSKQRGWKCFDTRDVIVVLTDGDINDGITDGQELVRQVRQAIRGLEMEGEHYNREPSLTISTVITGNNVTEAVYLLSKMCGSDAFYYIEKDTDTLEIGALMPVFLRMNSVASSISIQAVALDPAELLPKVCSHEYMAHRPHERDDEIWYFLHDIGLGMSKHLLIVLDKESVLCETDLDAAVLRVKVEYRDAMMEKRSFTHEVLRSEFAESKPQQSLAVGIQDIRRISQLALRKVADDVKDEKSERAVAGLLQSIEEVEEQVEGYCGALGRPSERQVLTDFVQSVTANLANLMTVIEDSQKTTGNKWSAVKSVSSAIVREAPSAPKLLSRDQNLKNKESPSPEVMEMRRTIRDQYMRKGVKSALFFDFDVTMEELSDTLKRGERPPYFPEEPLIEEEAEADDQREQADDQPYRAYKADDQREQADDQP